MTIVEFLLARIAEDEAAANAAATYSADWCVGDPLNETVLLRADDESGNTFDSVYGQIAPFIARFDPARMLAECEAKRRIVESCANWLNEADRVNASPRQIGDVADMIRGQAVTAWFVLRTLATIGNDHPDYDPAWRP